MPLCFIFLACEYFYENTPPPTNNDKLFKWLVYSVGDANQPLRKASYWALVNDLQNLLAHGEIARRFFRDQKSMGNYMALIAPMQGIHLRSYKRRRELLNRIRIKCGRTEKYKWGNEKCKVELENYIEI